MKEDKQFLRYNLKISTDLHATLSEHAKKNKRSLQAEIIQRLEQSLVPSNEKQLTKNNTDTPSQFIPLELLEETTQAFVEIMFEGKLQNLEKNITSLKQNIADLRKRFDHKGK